MSRYGLRVFTLSPSAVAHGPITRALNISERGVGIKLFIVAKNKLAGLKMVEGADYVTVWGHSNINYRLDNSPLALALLAYSNERPRLFAAHTIDRVRQDPRIFDITDGTRPILIGRVGPKDAPLLLEGRPR